MVYYPLVLIQFVLNFFADSDPRLSDYAPVEVSFPKYFYNCLSFYFHTVIQFLETMS